VLVARDDDVIENREAQHLPGPHDVGGRRDVLGARGGVPGRVVVSVLLPTGICSPLFWGIDSEAYPSLWRPQNNETTPVSRPMA
jgi:hypothetical protein